MSPLRDRVAGELDQVSAGLNPIGPLRDPDLLAAGRDLKNAEAELRRRERRDQGSAHRLATFAGAMEPPPWLPETAAQAMVAGAMGAAAHGALRSFERRPGLILPRAPSIC